MTVTLKTDGLKRLGLGLRFLDDLYLSFGVLEKDGSYTYESGINLATVALYNEFGTTGTDEGPGANKGVPARSFLRGTLHEERDAIAKRALLAVRQGLTGKKTMLDALGGLGKYVVNKVQDRMQSSLIWAEENAEATVKAKGYDWPLHDTGKLSESISWAIRKGGPDGPIIREGKGRKVGVTIRA